jgi:hypothetical protein
LCVVDQTVSGEFQTSTHILAVLELLELSGGLGLGDLLARDLSSGDLLNRINGGLGGRCDALCGAGDEGEEQTGVGVDGVGGVDLDARSRSVAEDGEAGGPLNSGLSAEQRAEHSQFGLVELAGEGAGTGESNDHGVAAVVGNALLAANVLGLRLASIRLLAGLGGHIVEELVHPFGEVAVVSAVGNHCKVGLGVCDLGVVFDGGGVEVLRVGRLRGGGGRGAEAAVEGEAVGGVGGHGGDAREEAPVGEVDEREDLLIVDVGCSLSVRGAPHGGSGRTLVLGLAGDLGEQLDEVGQVVAEELGLEDDVLARVVRVQGRAQELRLAHNAQRRPPFGALQAIGVSRAHPRSREVSHAYPECEVGEALGEAGQRLVAGTGLCNQRERRRGACEVAAGELDALGLAGLVLERA